jgi:dipeptidyl aminopeptidase/acylaminoacyl peptidase
MNHLYRKIILSLPVFLLLLVSFSAASAQTEKEDIHFSVNAWLKAGPLPVSMPAFHDQTVHEFTAEDILKYDEQDMGVLKPASGQAFTWVDGASYSWDTIQVPDREMVLPPAETMSFTYLAAYIEVQRWTRARLSLRSPQIFRVYLDGQLAATKAVLNNNLDNDSRGRKSSADLDLETGKHLILIKLLYQPDMHGEWILYNELTVKPAYAVPRPLISLSPRHNVTLARILESPTPLAVSVSPGGELGALTISRTYPPGGETETWINIYCMDDRTLVRSFRGGRRVSQVNWASEGRVFSYITREKDSGTLWVVDLDTEIAEPVLKDIDNLGIHAWAPDGKSIIYSTSEEGEKDRPGIKRLRSLEDRQPGARRRSYLYQVYLNDGFRRRLTTGELSTYLNSFHPSGDSLLFTRSVIDYTRRPYSQTQLFSLDLKSLNVELLHEGPWVNSAEWSPDGKWILVLGGPSAFGSAGVNVPKDMVPNEYDTQAYMMDPDSKDILPVTKTFAPSINQAVWAPDSGSIFFVVTEKSYRNLYRYQLSDQSFTRISTPGEVIHQFSRAEINSTALLISSGAAMPHKAYGLNLESGDRYLFADPGAEAFQNVIFGKVERWTFTNPDGIEIEGRVYYPPDFNPRKKYPAIINYYGGTSPVERSFGGRYPLNYYAANGYIVYVLQPSGAVGFGQKFSALHVNDWGNIVSREIIQGVKEFLNAHSFVDPQRIGCIGASYGGFMTMHLLTRTNIFTTGIAHAGISSLASYWGEGYWGYTYSAIATADAFPWNRQDIYVDQSPLYNADKISTPLLLLHGAVDTNVPPGESIQLFTALKLLGREAEYIQIEDQNHHIMEYNKRILWTKTIMAWFDRWLKQDPHWWLYLYPPPGGIKQ